MDIRRLDKNDMDSALPLVWRVFAEFEAPIYTKAGIEEFKNFIEHETIVDKISNNEMSFWGCFDKTEMTGVIATRGSSHISLLFVAPAYHRQGIARRLFHAMRNSLPDGTEEITVNASPYAAEAYRHLGFADTGEEQTKNGIRFIPMAYEMPNSSK